MEWMIRVLAIHLESKIFLQGRKGNLEHKQTPLGVPFSRGFPIMVLRHDGTGGDQWQRSWCLPTSFEKVFWAASVAAVSEREMTSHWWILARSARTSDFCARLVGFVMQKRIVWNLESEHMQGLGAWLPKPNSWTQLRSPYLSLWAYQKQTKVHPVPRGERFAP